MNANWLVVLRADGVVDSVEEQIAQAARELVNAAPGANIRRRIVRLEASIDVELLVSVHLRYRAQTETLVTKSPMMVRACPSTSRDGSSNATHPPGNPPDWRFSWCATCSPRVDHP